MSLAAVAVALGAACYLPLVMVSVPAGLAVAVAAMFLVPGIATTWMMLLIAAAWVGGIAAGRASVRELMPGQRFLVGALALLLAWLCLSLLWAKDPEMAWQDLRWWLVAGGLLVVVATTSTKAQYVRLIVLAFVVGALLSVAVGVLGLGPTPGPASANRFTGAAGNPDDLAAQLLPAIVLAAALIGGARLTVARVAYGASLAILSIGVVATQSRGALVAAGLAALAAAAIYKHRRRYVLLGAALAVAVVGASVALFPSTLRHVTTINDGGAGRSTLWLVAWRIAKDYTPEGIGLNNFRIVAPDYVRRPGALRYVRQIDRPHVVHNTYLQLLAETGIVGLGLFLAVVGACLASARKAANLFARAGDRDLARVSLGVFLATFATLGVQLFISNGYDARLWVLLALGPALLTIAIRRQDAAPA